MSGISASVIFCALVGWPVDQITLTEPPHNVIVFIGDGMGFEQVKAAGMYANGAPGTFSFEVFPNPPLR